MLLRFQTRPLKTDCAYTSAGLAGSALRGHGAMLQISLIVISNPVDSRLV